MAHDRVITGPVTLSLSRLVVSSCWFSEYGAEVKLSRYHLQSTRCQEITTLPYTR